MCKAMIILGILCLIASSYSVSALWYSSTFGGEVEVIFDISTPVLTLNTINNTAINISWTDDATKADTTYVEWCLNNDTGWSRDDHTEVCNESSNNYYVHTGLTPGETYYYKAWSYNDTRKVWSSGSAIKDARTTNYQFYQEVFGGNVTVSDQLIDVEINSSTWKEGSVNSGTDIIKNFTLWQNGSSNIDIGINITTTNFSFVTYSTWSGNGHEQICANHSNSTPVWNSEYNINPDNSTKLIQDHTGQLDFGIRIWTPTSKNIVDKREDFEVNLYVSEST